jgi:lipopolysaccharide/colanic/teichoic acid biosynthesis glycosyltransferase
VAGDVTRLVISTTRVKSNAGAWTGTGHQRVHPIAQYRSTQRTAYCSFTHGATLVSESEAGMPSTTTRALLNDVLRPWFRNRAGPQIPPAVGRAVVQCAAACTATALAGMAVSGRLAGSRMTAGVGLDAAVPPEAAWMLLAVMSGACYLVATSPYQRGTSPFRKLRGAGIAAVTAVTVLTWIAAGTCSGVPDAIVLAAVPVCLAAASQLAPYASGRADRWALHVAVAGRAASVGGYHHRDDQVTDESARLPAVSDVGGRTLSQALGHTETLRPAAAGDSQSVLRPEPLAAQSREGLAFAPARSASGLRGPASHLISPFGQNAPITWPSRSAFRRIQTATKSLLDVTLAAAALTFAGPVLLAITLAVRLDGGPALFRHRRLGYQGRHFYCLKFRTMVVDAEQVLERAFATDPALAAEWDATHKLKRDPRITRIGAVLRRSSLDELPQLINVLRCEMSLVGPRPITDPEVPRYGSAISHYYTARPGITGLWQVSGRSDTTYEQRVRLDVHYIMRWSLWLDLVVLFRTVPAVIKRRGAH